MKLNFEIYNGMKMMKYATNHSWKFRKYKSAFTAGLLQAVAGFVITIVNYLVILQADNALELAKDYAALMIIADFDNIYYQASGLTLLKEILEYNRADYDDLFKIETTTSMAAKDFNNEDLDDDPIYAQIKANADDRYKKKLQQLVRQRDDSGSLLARISLQFHYP